ncbi:MAG: DUF3592 domain-containing protein [Lachnospiraceae bacterium]|nr:DUF3592 domain-containing protein [Lachnospiraceae bacterium]
MKCPFCGMENDGTKIKCEYCGEVLYHIENNSDLSGKYFSDEEIQGLRESDVKINDKKVGCFTNTVLIFVLGIWFLFGFIFVIMSLTAQIHDWKITKNYAKTEAVLVGSKGSDSNFEDKNGSYNALYEFTVDGVTYQASPNKSGNKSSFKKKATVKYNPDNPSENYMYAGWHTLFITGLAMMATVVIIFIFVKRKVNNMVATIKDIQGID